MKQFNVIKMLKDFDATNNEIIDCEFIVFTFTWPNEYCKTF